MAFVLRREPILSAKLDAYPYQLDAVHAIKDLPYAAIFHEPGLGKTKIAIDVALLWLKNDVVDTVLIVTKKSLVDNWCNEIVSHCHITPHVLSGNRSRNSASLNSPVLLYVTNYEVVVADAHVIKMFLRTCRVAGILDESHKIKSPESRVTRTFHDLSSLFERRIIMTGTPSANRPYDIWSQIMFLDGGEALGDTFEGFKQLTDLPSVESRQYGNHLEDVGNRIADFTVRDTKDTAGIELPRKIIRSRIVELPDWQMQIYRSYRDELGRQLEHDGTIVFDDVENILKRLLRLVQCASNPALIDGNSDQDPAKLPLLLQLCREVVVDSKLIVWTGFVNNVVWLSDRLSEFGPVRIHGGMAIHDRNQSVRSFMESSGCRILVATPGAAKEGLTLTAANHAVFFDRSFRGC